MIGDDMNNKELVIWIEQLISINRLDKFYHSKYFKHIKREVLREQHYECQRCKEQGRLRIVKESIKRSGVVHHVKEVREHPELALDKYYYDSFGRKHRQLLVLCNECHEIEHNRAYKREPKFINEERW